MKGKISIKTVIVLVILVLVGVLSVLGVGAVQQYVSGAAGGTDPKGVLATPGEDGKSAAVVWTTDKPAQGVVEYGTTPASLLLRSLETDAAAEHKVNLTPLKPNTSYYFRIRVGDQIYDNSGIPFSFKTKPGSEEKLVPTAVKQVPTLAVVPTSTGASASGSGTCDHTTDYNKDGVVNSIDFIKCVKEGLGEVNKCPAGVDFDGNGVVNSVDMIKCLQSQK